MSNWKGFTIRGKFYDLSHLQPFDHVVEVDGVSVTLHVTFGHHCFTDKKENGPLLYPKEGRYWSQDRYECTHNLRNIITNRFMDAYAVPYLNMKNNEQYHYLELEEFDYSIFFDVNKPANTTDRLKLKIVSAYERDQWGTAPKGSPKLIRWILAQRIKGKNAL